VGVAHLIVGLLGLAGFLHRIEAPFMAAFGANPKVAVGVNIL